MQPFEPNDIADLSGLEQRLRAIQPETRGPWTLHRFGLGRSNPTYLLEADDTRLVLRRKPFGELLATAHQIEREVTILRALEGSGFPAPRVVDLCEDPGVIGAPFYLMTYIEGRVSEDPRLPSHPPADRPVAYNSFIDTLVALHAVDWRAVGLSDFGRPDGYIPRQVSRWTRQYRASEREAIPAMDALIGALEGWSPEGRPATIVHGDFRLGNLLFAPDRPQVVGVLDWELSTIGEPLSDLAYAVMLHHIPEQGAPYLGLLGADLAGQGLPGEAEVLERYTAGSGRRIPEDWPRFLALAFFRAAAIAQGVYARSLAGMGSEVDGAQAQAAVPFLADSGLAQLKRGP